ncbi:MAG: hypothetical protein M1820_002313 [Bogoriella megaspora]|nr:MAG: hypothetical protein M1820_002313 [Bogoriella megaspora]
MNARVAEAVESVRNAANADSQGTGEAHVRLLDAVSTLRRAVETPAERLMRLRTEPVRNASMRMALETGAFHLMCEKQGKSVTAQELSEPTGYDALFIGETLFYENAVAPNLTPYSSHLTPSYI